MSGGYCVCVFVAEVSRILIRLEDWRQDRDDGWSWFHYFSVSAGMFSLIV